MKITVILLLFYLCTCSPEKEIQVWGEVWVLIEKRPATRYNDDDFVWLIWQNKYKVKYCEKIPEEIAGMYSVGMQTYNRTKR